MNSYTVRDNDDMWNVAEALLDDGSRHVEMAELALGQDVAPGIISSADTLVVHPGWVFTLDTATPAAPVVDLPDNNVHTDVGYTVAKSDSLSSIARPQSEGVVAAMTAIVTAYARRLIDLAVEVDDIALVLRTTAAAGRVLDSPIAESPFRQAEEDYAEACVDEELMAFVDGARDRLLAYLRDEDSLATP